MAAEALRTAPSLQHDTARDATSVHHYSYQRYHEALRDVTPFDVYMGRHLEVLPQRKEAKKRTIEARRSYNSTVRGQGFGA